MITVLTEETQIRIRRLELEHQDLVELRNAIVFAEWGIPLGIASIIATVLASLHVIPDFISLCVFGFTIWLSYRIIKQEQITKDNLLEGIRNQIDDIIESGRKATSANTA